MKMWDHHARLYWVCNKIRLHVLSVGRTEPFSVSPEFYWCDAYWDKITNSIGHKWMRYGLKTWYMANFAVATVHTCYYSVTRSLELVSAIHAQPVDNNYLHRFIAWFEKLRGGGGRPLPIEGSRPVRLLIEGPAKRLPVEPPIPPLQVPPPIEGSVTDVESAQQLAIESSCFD